MLTGLATPLHLHVHLHLIWCYTIVSDVGVQEPQPLWITSFVLCAVLFCLAMLWLLQISPASLQVCGCGTVICCEL